jgi:hypothetical protein
MKCPGETLGEFTAWDGGPLCRRIYTDEVKAFHVLQKVEYTVVNKVNGYGAVP